MAALGDMDGDGVVDMAVGVYRDDDGGVSAGAVYTLFLNSDGTTKNAQKMSNLYGNFNTFYSVDADDRFGMSRASLGDLDGDGVVDLAVGAFGDDDGSFNAGAAYVVSLAQTYCVTPSPTTTPLACNSDGIAGDAQKLSFLYGSVSAFYTLEAGDAFGVSVAAIGDLDGDGVGDLVVGANEDDDGGSNTGSVYVFFLGTDGTVISAQKLSMLYGNFNSFYTLAADDRFGLTILPLGDVDSDGVADLAVGAGLDDDGGSIAGAAYILFLKTDGTVMNAQKLSALYGNFNAFYTLIANDLFGRSVAAPGDLDGDSVVDMAVGAVYDTDGGSLAGAVYLLFLETDGTCKSVQKMSNLHGSFNTYYTLAASDHFGVSMTSLEDLNGDSVIDLAVGAYQDDDGGTDAGAACILFLETNGTVKDAQKLSNTYGSFNSHYTLSTGVLFGSGVAALGDINGDGVVDMAVGVYHDDDGGASAGAVYTLFLNSDGTIKNAQKMSNLYGNFNTFYSVDADDRFGMSLASLGDLDGDNVIELAVGTFLDDDGGTDAGAAYIVNLQQTYCETPSPTT